MWEFESGITMKAAQMKHLCIVLIVCWSSVVNGNAVGQLLSQLHLKSNGNNVELYRESGNGSSWLQMLFVFARDSSNSQSASLIQKPPCAECDKTTACKEGFIELESKKCYYFGSHHEKWHNALKVCQGMVTTLAYPMNANENTALLNYIKANFSETKAWWMGGSDEATEGEWIWAHNKAIMMYTDWLQAQPSGRPNEHCLLYWKADGNNWKWNDMPCTDAFPFICQQ